MALSVPFILSWFRQTPENMARSKVIALAKPNKPKDDPKSYCPIALLCVPFKIMERILHTHHYPVIDLQLPKEQPSFRHGRSTTDQVTLLTQDIEDSFQAGKKASAVFLKTILDKHIVKFIMEMVSNCSFILHTNNRQHSRLRRLRNVVPQGSVLALMLLNIYIHDLPTTESKKYRYADNLAILLSNPSWSRVERGLNHDCHHT